MKISRLQEEKFEQKARQYLKKREKKRTIISIVFTVLLAVGFISLITSGIILGEKSYNYYYNNPLDSNVIEETLEPKFKTNGVIVLNVKCEGDVTYYDISANGFYYRVEYRLQNTLFKSYWCYQNYIQISGEQYK